MVYRALVYFLSKFTWSFVGDIPFTISARLTRVFSWAKSRDRVAVPLSASSVERSLTLCWASFRPVPCNSERFQYDTLTCAELNKKR